MLKTNKRAVSQPSPGRAVNPTTAAASAAAALAFAKKQNADAGLSAAAAAAALRSHTTTPVPISEIQTKRMLRRGSTSSFGSNTGSLRQPFGGPSLQRRMSNSSMTERTFRSPSPGPNRRRAPSISSISEVPQVPALPTKHQGRPASYDPQMRASMTSPTPSTSSRTAATRKGPPGGNLARVPEQREREYVEAADTRRSVNFSRPMSPPPTATAPREAIRTRPASSQGFYSAQNHGFQPQQRQQQQPSAGQTQRQTPLAARKTKVPRADSILEESFESPPPRSVGTAAARPVSTTPRTKVNAASATTSSRATNTSSAVRPASQTTTRPGTQTTARPISQAAARPASQTTAGSITQSTAKSGPRPPSTVAASNPKVTPRPASAMSQSRQTTTGVNGQNSNQVRPRPTSAMAQSRANQPAWPPSVMVQQTGQRGPPKIATGMPDTPMTFPSPTQDQMRAFQTRTAPKFADSTPIAAPTTQTSNAVGQRDKQAGPYQPARPVVTKRASASSISSQQRERSTSQPVFNLPPTIPAARRTPSASPARSARFSSVPLLETARHQPPIRSASPAKSSLKPSSLRTSSPESSYRQGVSDNSDSRSVVSVESSSKKRRPRVNFDDTPQVLEPAIGLSLSTKSMWMAEPASEMGRTPALPSFESIRGRKNTKDSKIAKDGPAFSTTPATGEFAVIEAAEPPLSTTVATFDPLNVETAHNPVSELDHSGYSHEAIDDSQANTAPALPMEQFSKEGVPDIAVMPATPRLDQDIRSMPSVSVPSAIRDEDTRPVYPGQGVAVADRGVLYYIPGPYEHDYDSSKVVSGPYTHGVLEPATESENNIEHSAETTILPGSYTHTSIGSSFVPITSTYEVISQDLTSTIFPPSPTQPTIIPGAYVPGSMDYAIGSGKNTFASSNGVEDNSEGYRLQHDSMGVNGTVEHDVDMQDPNSINDTENHDVDDIGNNIEALEADNKPLSAIYEGPIVDNLRNVETHPAFRPSHLEGDDVTQHTGMPAAEQDWERVRAYWSSLSEQRKQQLEHEAGVDPEVDQQPAVNVVARSKIPRSSPPQLVARTPEPQRRVLQQPANNRSVGNQAPLPPWPDQQYQESVRKGPPPKQHARMANQRGPSHPPNGRPQSAQVVQVTQKKPSPANVRPASVTGDSYQKSISSQTGKPLKGVLKNANAPQPPLIRTFSNDSSESDSSFRQQRQQRRRGDSSHSMKRSMRAPHAPPANSVDVRSASSAQVRGGHTISTSPSRASANRPLRTSMRGSSETVPIARVSDQGTSKPSSGSFGNTSKQKPAAKIGSKFRSRYDDSSDEDDARPTRRKMGTGGFGKITGVGGLSRSGGGGRSGAAGGGGGGGGGGGFRSRFADSDDEDVGSPNTNGHAQGSSLLSGTMRNSVDGSSPKKRNLFGGGMKKPQSGFQQESESAPTSPAGNLSRPLSRPNVFRRISLSRSAQTIPGAGTIDESIPVPAIPDQYQEYDSNGGGMLAAKLAANKTPQWNGNKEEIVSSRTGKKKRFQGLRRVLGLND